ncbi:MAG: bifunctional precorrin-2 dehydrogenase/sirohydrochlorin ferrochelatase [Magnetococcus sp. DMHC-6]
MLVLQSLLIKERSMPPPIPPSAPENFPLFLRLDGRPCLVVGGDQMAFDKIQALLSTQAQLTVVAPELTAELFQLVQLGQVHWIQSPFQPTHLEGQWLVVCTLTDPIFLETLYQQTCQRKIFLNVVDQPRYCTAFWPATLKRPPITLAFSSSGQSPALMGYLRRRLNAWLPENFGELATWLGQWRQRISSQLPNLETKAKFWRDLLEAGLIETFFSENQEAADQQVQAALKKMHISHTVPSNQHKNSP